MHRRSVLQLISILFGSLLVTSGLLSQSLLPQVNTPSIQADSVEAIITPIPINEINNASTEAFSQQSRAGSNRLDEPGRIAIISAVDSIVKETNSFLADTVGVNFNELNFRELDALNNTVYLLLNRLEKRQEEINRPLQKIQESRNNLMKSKRIWELTLENSASEGAPEAIQKRISGVIRKSDSVSLILQNDIDFLLTQSDKITSQQINLDQFSITLEAFNTLSSERVFRKDMPAIWSSFNRNDTAIIAQQWQNFKSNLEDDTNLLTTKYSGQLILFACLFVILIVLVFWTRGTVKQSELKGSKVILSLYVNEIFLKPFEISLLLGLYIIRLLMPDMPETYSSILEIIAVYAVLRVAFDILPASFKRHLLEFAIAYLLFKFYNLFYDQYFLSRIVLLSIQTVTFLFLFRYIVRRANPKLRRKSVILSILAGVASFYLVLIFLSIIGNLIGILSLAEFMTSAIIQSTFLVLTTYVGFHVSVAMVYLLLSSVMFSWSNIINKQFKYIINKLYQILQLIFILSWIIITLSFFNIKQPFFDWGLAFLTKEMHIGQAAFSLINIILFIFVIWLSMFISRLVRFILNEEVFTRIKVERGVPSTVVMLVRITLISIGFLLAAAAAGMELSSLTIIIGAFSVGIGFGLQNIFNNLVSGLILAFERPIKEGDTVEVNALLGVVKKIGIRSSVVRTYDGAEVIVPNGTLISNELINWTLSDPHRRLDIRVGVAYGTDPSRVLEILRDTANKNVHILKNPEPKGYFIGFGDSSLDFRLLAWAEQEMRYEVESQIRLEINREIKKAGIEIPFPQRDLHVRSVDGKVVKEVKGDRGEEEDQGS